MADRLATVDRHVMRDACMAFVEALGVSPADVLDFSAEAAGKADLTVVCRGDDGKPVRKPSEPGAMAYETETLTVLGV